MPEERFYQEFVEKNKKSDIKRAKNKVRKRLLLLALVFLLAIFLLVNKKPKEENYEEKVQVESAKSITQFEPVLLADGSKITIKRVTVKGSEGIIYLNKETPDMKQESLTISISNINEQDNEINVDENGLKLKIDLTEKTVEEVKE